jgi:hypothetical protein
MRGTRPATLTVGLVMTVATTVAGAELCGALGVDATFTDTTILSADDVQSTAVASHRVP